MTHLLEFKEKIEKRKLKNLSVEKIEKNLNSDRRLLFLYTIIFLAISMMVLIVASSINAILGLSVLAIIYGFFISFLYIGYCYGRTYLFLRKISYMYDNEDFEE